MNGRSLLNGLVVAALFAGLFTNCSKNSPPMPSPTVRSVAVSGSATASVGGTTQLSATATLSDNSTQTVTSLSTWTSSTPAVASVSSSGLVQGLTAGSTNITATYQQVMSPVFGVQVSS